MSAQLQYRLRLIVNNKSRVPFSWELNVIRGGVETPDWDFKVPSTIILVQICNNQIAWPKADMESREPERAAAQNRSRARAGGSGKASLVQDKWARTGHSIRFAHIMCCHIREDGLSVTSFVIWTFISACPFERQSTGVKQRCPIELQNLERILALQLYPWDQMSFDQTAKIVQW